MSYFDKIFLDTTDPETNYSRLVRPDVAASIIAHTLFYIGLVYTVSSVFRIKLANTTYMRIPPFLFVVMILGYVGRLTRVKTLYTAFLERGNDSDEAYTKSTALLRNAYFTYYFLG